MSPELRLRQLPRSAGQEPTYRDGKRYLDSRMSMAVTTPPHTHGWIVPVVLLLCASQSTLSTHTINMALLAPQNSTFGINVSTSVLAVINAVEDIKEKQILPGYNINVTWYDSACEPNQAIGIVVDTFISKKVDVLIGPPCSKAADAVGHLAAYYNIPMFTWYGPSAELSDKKSLSTLVRTFAPAEELGRQVVEALNTFKWRTCALVYSRSKLQLGHVILVRLQEEGIEVSHISEVGDVETPAKITSRFIDIKMEARIIILALPIQELRKYMLVAYDQQMVKGDFVFLSVQYDIPKGSLRSNMTWKGNDGRNNQAMMAFRSLLHLSAVNHLSDIHKGGRELMKHFVHRGRDRASRPPWRTHLPTPPPPTDQAQFDQYAPYLYDAIYLYAMAANATLEAGGDIADGNSLQDNSRLINYTGAFSEVVMGPNADRMPDIWYLGMDEDGETEPIAYINPQIVNGNINSTMEVVRTWPWPPGHPPEDTPKCGFDGSKCPMMATGSLVAIGVGVCTLLVILAVVIVALSHRRRTVERLIGRTTWDVQYDDIKFKFGRDCRELSIINDPRLVDGMSKHRQLGIYRASVVEVCYFDDKPVPPKQALRVELSQMRHLTHPNLNAFLGACLSGPVCILWQHCPKGTLQEVLANKTMKLDAHFKLSFLTDIIKGMVYLHSSKPPISHGSLTSLNVVVDSRWCAKVTHYGLRQLKIALKLDKPCARSNRKAKQIRPEDLFWTSPELLGVTACARVPGGTTKGDMYSFGVIFKEVLSRTGPYDEVEGLTAPEIVEKVRNPDGEKIFRPQLSRLDTGVDGQDAKCVEKYKHLIKQCWAQEMNKRLSFKLLLTKIQEVRGGTTLPLMDNMLLMLEKYADHLEETVAERTQQLNGEKRKTDILLYRMLPKSVAESLKQGRTVMAESFESVTIYFSDIVGFTDIAAESTPLEIVALLNALYSLFDDIITHHDVYKVETIGDAYMIVSGLPNRNEDKHAAEVGNCALDLCTAVDKQFKIPHRPQRSMAIRIGLHTGPCVAGVVGLAMPRYCLFGDTVNTASRMESNGEAMKIHISCATYNSLLKLGKHKIALRGDIPIKGKGTMTTYWLLGRLEPHKYVTQTRQDDTLNHQDLELDMNDNVDDV